MSSTELHIGKLREIDLGGKHVEEVAKTIAEELHHKSYTPVTSYLDDLLDIYPPEYFYVNDKLYKIIVDVEYEDGCEDISTLTKNEEGDYEFVMQFYNGGTCFSEMIEDALSRIE